MSQSLTLLFPGQGSQYVGMGKILEGKQGFERLGQADASLSYSLSTIMLEGPEEQLKLTQNTQPAILTYSIALLDELLPVFKQNDIQIERVLGHSVGEYAALVAAGSLDFMDAVKAVHLRGKYMQEAVPQGQGKMIALLRIPLETVEKICAQISTDNSPVMPANYNEPGQTVISGSAQACDQVVSWLSDNYKEPYRAVELNVSAPFHSSLMEPAAERLKEHLSHLKFSPNQYSYVANVDAHEYAAQTSPETIKENLYKQVAGAVRWTQSIESLPDGSLCLEVGPGKVLMGLVRKINRQIKVLPVDSEDVLGQLDTKLKELFS